MKIDIYRFYKFNSTSNVKAFFDLILDDEVILKGFKLVAGKESLFLSGPREKNKEGKYFDLIIFNNLSRKNEIEKLAIERYNNTFNEIPKVQ